MNNDYTIIKRTKEYNYNITLILTLLFILIDLTI